MRKRFTIGVLAVAVLLAGGGWLYRKDVILHAVTSTGRMDVAENRAIAWMSGPATPQLPASERPPLYPSSTESPICIDRTLADLPCPGDDYVIWPN